MTNYFFGETKFTYHFSTLWEWMWKYTIKRLTIFREINSVVTCGKTRNSLTNFFREISYLVSSSCKNVTFTKFLSNIFPHYTVWKFYDFSVTQILREINFGEIYDVIIQNNTQSTCNRYTVWKFQNFSAIQILREIDFGVCRRSKTALFAFIEALKVQKKALFEF